MQETSEMLEKAREYEKKSIESDRLAPRQTFHVCSPVGWINDPNGFSEYKGEYHLFYQYHPYSTVWGPMHWGHAKTKDFIKWEQLPAALAPDMKYDAKGCFSGSAIEWNGNHVLIYTGVTEEKKEDGTLAIRQQQCIATGDGLEYEKLSQNPVIKADTLPAGSSEEDFRDPKAWVDGEYVYMVAGSRAADGSGQIPLYRTKNLRDWEFVSIIEKSENKLGKMWECPDFFSVSGKQVLVLSPQEMEAQGMEFHNGNVTAAVIGSFDKNSHEFRRENVQAIDYGLDFYAPQTMETTDGRRIMIGWMQSWDNPMFTEKMGWSGCMSIPRELSVIDGRLYQQPVKELEKYYVDTVCYENIEIAACQSLDEVNGRFLDMTIELHEGDYSEFSMHIAKNEKYFTKISYDRKHSLLVMDRSQSGINRDILCERKVSVANKDGKIKLRIIMDRYSMEVFANDGEQAASMLLFTPIEAEAIEFLADGNVKADIKLCHIDVKD